MRREIHTSDVEKKFPCGEMKLKVVINYAKLNIFEKPETHRRNMVSIGWAEARKSI